MQLLPINFINQKVNYQQLKKYNNNFFCVQKYEMKKKMKKVINIFTAVLFLNFPPFFGRTVIQTVIIPIAFFPAGPSKKPGPTMPQ
jgi:hypothetical protein